MVNSDRQDSTDWSKLDEIYEMAKKNKPEYLHSWDLSLKCPAITIFDMNTFKPVHIQHFLMKGKPTHGKRLYELYTTVELLNTIYPPTATAFERGFERFHTATQVLYRVVGVFNMAYRNTPQFYYPPKTVKAALLDGNATKKQLQALIVERYPEIVYAEGDPGEDESDSTAIGVTHLIQHKNMPWEKPEKKKKVTKPRKKKEKEEK